MYVLRAAGYHHIQLIDPDGLEYVSRWKRPIKKALLHLYVAHKRFSFRVSGSAYHQPSPQVFGWEVRVCAA
jgi:hypothetical protein